MILTRCPYDPINLEQVYAVSSSAGAFSAGDSAYEAMQGGNADNSPYEIMQGVGTGNVVTAVQYAKLRINMI